MTFTFKSGPKCWSEVVDAFNFQLKVSQPHLIIKDSYGQFQSTKDNDGLNLSMVKTFLFESHLLFSLLGLQILPLPAGLPGYREKMIFFQNQNEFPSKLWMEISTHPFLLSQG